MAFSIEDFENMSPTGELERHRWERTRGMWFQMTRKGAKSWIYRGKIKGKGKGASVNLTICRFGEMKLVPAEKECDRLRGLCEQGIDPRTIVEEVPAVVVEPTRPTLSHVFHEYETTYLPRKSKRYADYQVWAFNKYVKETLGAQRLHDLGGNQFDRLLNTMGGIGTTANRVQAMLSKLWNWARREYRDLPPNPLTGREQYDEVASERRLSTKELKQFGEVYSKSSDPLKGAVLFLLLTGSRIGALTALKAGDIHSNHLRFPLKTPGLKLCRRVILPKVAAELLAKLPMDLTHGQIYDCLERLYTAGGIDPLSPHDLRRTWISVAEELGTPPNTLDSIVSHSLGKVRDIYSQPELAPLLKASEKVSKHLLKTMGISL
jgi:integrase